jgi:hypothetical protein
MVTNTAKLIFHKEIFTELKIKVSGKSNIPFGRIVSHEKPNLLVAVVFLVFAPGTAPAYPEIIICPGS